MEAGDLDMDGDPDLILSDFWFPTPDTVATARFATNYSRRAIDESRLSVCLVRSWARSYWLLCWFRMPPLELRSAVESSRPKVSQA
jgi:hypothetical protein